MFNNIGSKIKTLAQVLTWIGIIGSSISGIVLMAEDEDLIAAGLLTIIFGCLFSWVGSFLLYGFGQLVENSDRIAANTSKNPSSYTAPATQYAPAAPAAQPAPDLNNASVNHMFCPNCGEKLCIPEGYAQTQSNFFCPHCGTNINL